MTQQSNRSHIKATGRTFVSDVDMSSAAIDRRLRDVAQLWTLCHSLSQARCSGTTEELQAARAAQAGTDKITDKSGYQR